MRAAGGPAGGQPPEVPARHTRLGRHDPPRIAAACSAPAPAPMPTPTATPTPTPARAPTQVPTRPAARERSKSRPPPAPGAANAPAQRGGGERPTPPTGRGHGLKASAAAKLVNRRARAAPVRGRRLGGLCPCPPGSAPAPGACLRRPRSPRPHLPPRAASRKRRARRPSPRRPPCATEEQNASWARPRTAGSPGLGQFGDQTPAPAPGHGQPWAATWGRREAGRGGSGSPTRVALASADASTARSFPLSSHLPANTKRRCASSVKGHSWARRIPSPGPLWAGPRGPGALCRWQLLI